MQTVKYGNTYCKMLNILKSVDLRKSKKMGAYKNKRFHEDQLKTTKPFLKRDKLNEVVRESIKINIDFIRKHDIEIGIF